MDSFYGITNSKVRKRSCLSPISNFASPNPYYRHTGPVVDQYLSPEAQTTALKNLNSPFLRYLQSARSLSISPSAAAEHPYSIGYKYYLSNIENSPRMEPPRPSRSHLLFSNSPVKVEEDVLVMDGVLLKNPPVDKNSGGLSSAGSNKCYKMDLCLSYLENSGFCRYGTKCQFAHGNKELHPSQLSYKTMFETPCKSYSLSGTCLFGSKCLFPHYGTSTTMATSTTQPVSPIKVDEPTSSIVNLKTTNWYPLDDDIEIQTATANTQSDEHFDARVKKVLYNPERTKRLTVFTQICQE